MMLSLFLQNKLVKMSKIEPNLLKNPTQIRPFTQDSSLQGY